jgi:hypothetical protein
LQEIQTPIVIQQVINHWECICLITFCQMNSKVAFACHPNNHGLAFFLDNQQWSCPHKII